MEKPQHNFNIILQNRTVTFAKSTEHRAEDREIGVFSDYDRVCWSVSIRLSICVNYELVTDRLAPEAIWAKNISNGVGGSPAKQSIQP